jgi:hypothetical protein
MRSAQNEWYILAHKNRIIIRMHNGNAVLVRAAGAALGAACVVAATRWGFVREVVLAALEAAGGSKELAPNMLLG